MQSLKNGSDIRGIAIAKDGEKINLTPEVSRNIAIGFYNFLKNKYKKENLIISIGTDPRLSADLLKDSLVESFINIGVKIIDCSLSTTPAMFMSTIFSDYSCDGAIMITASHLPYYYNGFKFFTKDGGLESEDIDFILSNTNPTISIKKGGLEKRDLLKDYSAYLVDFIRSGVNSKNNYEKPLLDFHIIVDAGNGSGGFFANQVLIPLGAKTGGSQFLNPDGNFPNHIPNPEDKEAMKSISKAVISSQADLGIIFDTDVDRAALVSKDGSEINRNSLIALISNIVLEENPGSTIVTDSVTSDGLTKYINSLGGVHHRFKRGYKNVINEAIRLTNSGENSPLAIETSGHAALLENYFLDDGAYLISKILITAAKLRQDGKSLDQLIKALEHPKSEKGFRIKIKEKDFYSYGENILKELSDFTKKNDGLSLASPNYEGVKLICDEYSGNGWFLGRLSLHEPNLVINIESKDEEGAEKILKIFLPFLKKFSGLDL